MPVSLSFFVISGPNCLLGRHALEQLWPQEYRALRDVASVAAAKMSPQQQLGKVPEVEKVKQANPVAGRSIARLPMAPNTSSYGKAVL